MGSDLIGFHTHDMSSFPESGADGMGYDHQYRVIAFDNRLVKADLFPLGVDFEKFSSAAQRAEVIEAKDSIIKNFPDKKIIFSVDRLDYTKGVTHRLTGFERFLRSHPEWLEKIVFILVSFPPDKSFPGITNVES